MSTDHSDAASHENGPTDELELAKPRTRVSRACARCRNRKDRCDGAHPTCANCQNASEVCVYEASTKKRGLKEGYVRSLEKLWTVLNLRIDGLEDIVVQILEDDRDILLPLWNHRQTGEELHSMWKDSRIHEALASFQSAQDTTVIHGTKRKRDRDSGDADAENDPPDLADILIPAYSVRPRLDNPSDGPTRLRSAQKTTTSFPNTVLLPSTASQILDQYFRFTHCWLPVLDRPHMLRRCYEFQRHQTVVDPTNSDLAVLTATFAYASQYTSHLGRGSETQSDVGGVSFAQLSQKCIPLVHERFELGHIQALLILSLCNIGKGDWDTAWLSVGVATRAWQRLPRNSTTGSQFQVATKQTCLILDTLIALRLGHKPQLCREDMISEGFLPEGGHEEWETWTAPELMTLYTGEPAFTISTFNNLTRIFLILNDLLQQTRGPPTTATTDQLAEASRALDLLAGDYRSPLADSTPRSPHQLWLKVSHFMAAAYVSACASRSPVSPLECFASVSNILQSWTSSSMTGMTVMPTFILGLVHATCEALFSRLPQSSLSSSMSSNMFGMKVVADRLEEMSASWSEARRLAMRVREHLGQSSGDFTAEIHAVPAKRQKADTHPINAMQTHHGSLNLWPPDPFTGIDTFSNAPRNSTPTAEFMADHLNFVAEMERSAGHVPFDHANPESSDAHRWADMPDRRNMSLDGAADAMGPGPNVPTIATSPSFPGDDIDALFREMAQLDTTEWATGRRQGLKDFGFHDDLTFEAFCNDPDRLYSSGAPDSQPIGAMAQGGFLAFNPNHVIQPSVATLNKLDRTGSMWVG